MALAAPRICCLDLDTFFVSVDCSIRGWWASPSWSVACQGSAAW
jgi:hypothetical protein